MKALEIEQHANNIISKSHGLALSRSIVEGIEILTYSIEQDYLNNVKPILKQEKSLQ
jgi:hypothetical protein